MSRRNSATLHRLGSLVAKTYASNCIQAVEIIVVVVLLVTLLQATERDEAAEQHLN